jgi:glyoxylase-like metal-dependent hydrolase (beta-lactamase superfamily II)
LFYDYAVFGEPDAPYRTDYFFWLLRSDHDELLVVDLGFDAEAADRMGRTMLRTPEDALRELGVVPKEISRVVLTHLHWDHTGNLDLFPEAELVVSQPELDFWLGPLGRHPHFRDHVDAGDLETVRVAREHGRVTALGPDTTIAPGVRALTLGGHSVGQVVLEVQTPSGPAIVASDAFHFYEEFERRRPFIACADLVGALRALDAVDELSDQGRRPLLAGHDPLVMERFSQSDADSAGLTVELV